MNSQDKLYMILEIRGLSRNDFYFSLYGCLNYGGYSRGIFYLRGLIRFVLVCWGQF